MLWKSNMIYIMYFHLALQWNTFAGSYLGCSLYEETLYLWLMSFDMARDYSLSDVWKVSLDNNLILSWQPFDSYTMSIDTAILVYLNSI